MDIKILAALAMATFPATAGEISFMPGDGSELSTAIRDQFVSPMTEGNGDTPFSWARTDIDGDGYDELFIRLGDEFCTAGGCALVGFRKSESGSWPVILTVIADGAETSGNGLVTLSDGERTEWTFDPDVSALVPTASAPTPATGPGDARTP